MKGSEAARIAGGLSPFRGDRNEGGFHTKRPRYGRNVRNPLGTGPFTQPRTLGDAGRAAGRHPSSAVSS